MNLRESGYRFPPEWAPQEAVWLSWPVHPDNWPGEGKLARIQALFAKVGREITRCEKLRINAAAVHHARIASQLEDAEADMAQVELFDHPTDDIWCRDHGPLFLVHPDSGKKCLTGWNFNGWGENFQPFDQDAALPKCIASSLSLPFHQAPITLEGGAIETNGAGTLITTEAVLLNENRNPGATKKGMAAVLSDWLGIDRVIWLDRGIEGDDTGGHIDDMVRFVNERTVIASVESDPFHPNYPILDDNLRRLRKVEPPLEIIELPNPSISASPGSRLPVLPASYVNFLILNESVLVPIFGQPMSDARAISTIANQFPDRRVIPIDCLDLVSEGGALHCISMQEPRC